MGAMLISMRGGDWARRNRQGDATEIPMMKLRVATGSENDCTTSLSDPR
ncbi:hypothetical protein BIFGAL_04323 [Bifidobacterium gallicum DSM 20093 = LMG 11596]|uniref:Uncharacterized protein n=1 Tax=Bifidobacterium gallicum DSM 20093 = LMG 11596 TaxID=561180 RepID=D1NWR7_9BIFI|nr:hypothetical protein BIFGAL_04323 [Bifidobacterium gallicum DSM 20093 = LMG 11596]